MRRRRSTDPNSIALEVHDDAGLQPERTTLAWVRTAALAATVCILFARTIPGPSALVVGVSVVSAFPALMILATSRRHHRRRVQEFVDGRVHIQVLPAISVSMGIATLAGTAVSLLLTEYSN